MNKSEILSLIQELSPSNLEGASLTQVARWLKPGLPEYRNNDEFFDIIVDLTKRGIIETVDSENSRIIKFD